MKYKTPTAKRRRLFDRLQTLFLGLEKENRLEPADVAYVTLRLASMYAFAAFGRRSGAQKFLEVVAQADPEAIDLYQQAREASGKRRMKKYERRRQGVEA